MFNKEFRSENQYLVSWILLYKLYRDWTERGVWWQYVLHYTKTCT